MNKEINGLRLEDSNNDGINEVRNLAPADIEQDEMIEEIYGAAALPKRTKILKPTYSK